VIVETELQHLVAQLHVDAEVRVLPLRSERQPVGRDGAQQKPFAQVRSLVRRLVLAAQQRDRAVESRIPKAERNRVAGGAGADDYCFRSSSRSLRSDQMK